MSRKPGREIIRKIAVRGAMAAGRIIRRYFATGVKVEYKGEVNIVTEADRASEAAVVKIIRRDFPDHRILAEEGGEHEVLSKKKDGISPFRWIIDPLDGTTNFAHSFPFFCVSIAFEVEGKMVFGLVYDPIRRELFIGEKGKGSRLNGKRIRVSKSTNLEKSLLVTGFAYDLREEISGNLKHFETLLTRSRGIRRTGSAALDLCYVASGRFDGFWEMKLHPWDTAAGKVIVEEAGGKVSDFSSGPFSVDLKEILATNGRIHGEMVRWLASHGKPGAWIAPNPK